ncbi:MAG: conjugal transfer protein TraN [Caedimonadaceae bacterium]|nr:MAG: conjugal transfer protein TraN [Caedimonadaceae bacterium]
METTQSSHDETVTCEESGDDAAHTCKSTLVVTIKEARGPLQQGRVVFNGPSLYHSHIHQGLFSMPRVKKRHFVAHIRNISHLLKALVSQRTKIPVSDIQSVSAGNNGDWVKVGHKRYSFGSYTVRYSYTPKIKIPVFSWTNECGALENKVDQGLCSYGSKVCTQGKQTRLIQGVPVTQDCWEYTFTYHCSYPSKDECGPLRARGCVQIHSQCKQKIGNTCVVYTQTYQCKGDKQTKYTIKGGQTPFCLDGNCRDQSWDKNDEMMSSLAQLTLLKEMQGKFKNGFIFSGEDNRCSKQPLSFKDCCGSGKGWGTDLGLASCSAEEKALSKKRKERLCHYVGTYCAKKLPVVGTCIKKKAVYCCFGSKLLKAFQEQGRSQISLGWGEPKEPLCRGFTVEEIQRIDFSKLDLREVFEDLMKNYTPSKMQNIGRQVGDRLEVIKKGMLPPTQTQPKQRNEG